MSSILQSRYLQSLSTVVSVTDSPLLNLFVIEQLATTTI